MNENIDKARIAIICEVGLNHMGDTVYADHYLDTLMATRPSGITFQVRERAWYEKGETEASIRLPDEYYRTVTKRLIDGGISFGIGICDTHKLDLFEHIGVDFYKVLSKDIMNKEFVDVVIATGKPVYISTGMQSEEEIALFLKGFGASVPSNLSLIHTQLSYEDADTNLRAIGRLKERFGIPVAFGLHTTDVNALYAALGFLPTALFFYVKGNRAIKHRDETHVIPLAECPAVISEIRRLEIMLGDGIKKDIGNRIPDQSYGKK